MTDEKVTPTDNNSVATPSPSAQNTDSVTVSKAELEQLRRDAARAAEAQARADRLAKAQKQSKTYFDPARKPAPPSVEELEAQARSEDAKAERGILKLATNPEFRDVLDADPTLRDLITNNPSALLPIYAAEAVDAEDAINMIKEVLNAKKPKPKVEEKKDEPKPTPPAGGANTTGPVAGNSADYEAARKNSNTEAAISGMIAAKMKVGAIKK